ncbi:hypothetical protein ACTA71_008331 [Dictyostelium dimigraforme]
MVKKHFKETNESDNDVAIIGIGFRLPSGNLNKSNDSSVILWDNLMKGFDGITILNQISIELKEKGIFSAMLGSLSSFHTSSQSVIKDQIIELNIESKLAETPVLSTVTTNLFDETTPSDSDYLFQNIEKPIYGSQDFTIASMEFKSSLILIDGVNQCLQTNIFQTETINNIQNIIDNKCNLTKLSNNQLYDHIKSKTGLQYSGEFKRVANCFLGDNCFKYYSSNIPSQNELLKHTKIYSLSECFKRIGDSYASSIKVIGGIFKSLTTIKDSLIIQSPLNELYSTYLQSTDSPIQNPSSSSSSFTQQYNELDKINGTDKAKGHFNYDQFISNQLYSNIIKRCPQLDIETIKSLNIEQLKEKFSSNIKYSRLFQSVFETIQSMGINDNVNDKNREYNETNTYHYKIILKSTRIIAKLLFPLENDVSNHSNDDTAQSLFNNEILEDFNSNNNIINHQHQIVCNIIKESLLPILNEKMVFRILGFGGFGGFGSSLSLLVLNKINELLQEFPNSEIDIEYTYGDIPFYRDSIIVDPDFSVLIDSKSASGQDNSVCTKKKSGLTTSQLAGIIIGSVCFAAVIVIVTVHFMVKRNNQKKLIAAVNKKMTEINNGNK